MKEPRDVFVRSASKEWDDVGGGIRRRVLAFEKKIMMVSVRFEAGAVGALHAHPHVQCALVQEGIFDVTIDGRTERLSAGDSFVVPADTVHGAVAVTDGVLVDVFTPMRDDFVA